MLDAVKDYAAETGATLWSVYTGLAAPAVAFVLIALLVKGWRDGVAGARAAWAQTRTTLALMAANAVIAAPITTLWAMALSTVAAAGHARLIDPTAYADWPTPLVFLAAIVVGDFIGYWRHRIEHLPWLWPAHAVHHSDDRMTWLTLERFHPINAVTTYVIDVSLLVVLGFPPAAIVANQLARHYYGYLVHADLPWTYGPLGRVLVSPAMHRWHHAEDPRAYGTNFATIFSVWDQMFGTWRVPGPCTAPLGVAGLSPRSWWEQLVHPLRREAYVAEPAKDVGPVIRT